jgi:predicted GNAT family N-acyltransferase
MTIEVIKVTQPAQLEQVFAIRREVSVVEQHCPPELEWEFEEESTHFMALANGVPAGAARWRKTSYGYKLERFAVLKTYRGTGVGQALVKAVMANLPAGASPIYLNAQVQAMPFYQKLGFYAVGQQFEEAGIQHYKMLKA